MDKQPKREIVAMQAEPIVAVLMKMVFGEESVYTATDGNQYVFGVREPSPPRKKGRKAPLAAPNA